MVYHLIYLIWHNSSPLCMVNIFYRDVYLLYGIYQIHWLIDWLVFNANLSSISAISWRCIKYTNCSTTACKYTQVLLLSVLLRCVDSDYPLDIFKLFSHGTHFVCKRTREAAPLQHKTIFPYFLDQVFLPMAAKT